jgi:FtsX-like permease family
VIALGLRLSVSGGREAIARLAAVVIAVGVGTGMLLATLAMMNAVGAWNNRHAWFWTGSERLPATAPAPGVAPLWWQTGRDLYDGQDISRFDLAVTGPTSPVPPGLPRDPGPGQYYASPALAALIKSPASQLAGRYPGRLAGIIGNAGLPSPGSLVIVIGYDPAQLAGQPGTTRVTSIATRLPPSSGSVSGSQPNPKGLQATPAEVEVNQLGTDFILSVIALAILAPVLIWVSTATRLSAARREQRFAALRLTGATRRQVSVLAGVEATVAAVIGAAIGFGLFFPLRVPLTGLRITGEGFFLGDFSLSPSDILLVAIGVPVASAVAARLALRRVTPRPPRAWRVIPLLAGVADLGFFVVHGEPASTGGQVLAILPGFLLIIAGLIIAGPWLTMAGARVLARRTSRPATMLAARRLADDPHTAFRAVSGLVLALSLRSHQRICGGPGAGQDAAGGGRTALHRYRWPAGLRRRAGHSGANAQRRLHAVRGPDHPHQPGDRQLHAADRRDRRADRPQAPVQRAPAHRGAARHAAPCRAA